MKKNKFYRAYRFGTVVHTPLVALHRQYKRR